MTRQVPDRGPVRSPSNAWQSGAISRDTLLHNFRTGEILPSARTNEQELELIRKEPVPQPIVTMGPRAVVAMGASAG